MASNSICICSIAVTRHRSERSHHLRSFICILVFISSISSTMESRWSHISRTTCESRWSDRTRATCESRWSDRTRATCESRWSDRTRATSESGRSDRSGRISRIGIFLCITYIVSLECKLAHCVFKSVLDVTCCINNIMQKNYQFFTKRVFFV